MNTPRGARRTDTKLSDGRELIYYDPADAPVRVPLEDTRGPAGPGSRRSSCAPTR